MSEHGARQHARYSASSADRRALCPGSVRMADAVPPRPSSEYAEEGTKAHHILEVSLRNGCREARTAWAEFSDYFMCDVDKDMCDAVQEALDYVYDLLDTYPDAQLLVEQRLHMPSLHAPDEAWGTTDIAVLVPSRSWLHVIDYKHGAGVAVDVIENRQLAQYGTSAVFNAANVGVMYARLTIIQPRAFHAAGPIRHWDVTFDDMLEWLDKLDAEIAASQKHDAPLVPGDKQCKWCPAATTCPAIEARALSVVGQTFASVKQIAGAQLPNPKEMPVDRLAYILDAKDMLEDWLKEVEKHAYELARQGYNVPGRKLVEAKARRRWYGAAEQVAEQLLGLLGNKYTLDDVMPRELINVTEADKLVAKAYKARVKSRADKNKAAEDAAQALAFLTLKESSGNTSLVPVTDPRPAVNLTATQFNAVALPQP